MEESEGGITKGKHRLAWRRAGHLMQIFIRPRSDSGPASRSIQRTSTWYLVRRAVYGVRSEGDAVRYDMYRNGTPAWRKIVHAVWLRNKTKRMQKRCSSWTGEEIWGKRNCLPLPLRPWQHQNLIWSCILLLCCIILYLYVFRLPLCNLRLEICYKVSLLSAEKGFPAARTASVNSSVLPASRACLVWLVPNAVTNVSRLPRLLLLHRIIGLDAAPISITPEKLLKLAPVAFSSLLSSITRDLALVSSSNDSNMPVFHRT
jgi:hypothetical protein